MIPTHERSTEVNAIVQYHPQLPAFLQDPRLFEDTDKSIAGIGGGQPPLISIRGSKWHLLDANGEESQVQQFHLDVIVLAGNEHVSKSYYPGAYDPNAAATPPTCFSDNGTAPSVQAMTPQSPLCANCPHNAWGSKVTPTGSQVKACSDSKKLAVVLATDTPIVVNGAASVAKAFAQVYLLRVPAASMRNWRDYAKDIRNRGVPIIGVVSRMSFDAEASYPALLFAATGFVASEAQFKQVCGLRDQPATLEAIGANDRPAGAIAGSAIAGPAPTHLTATAVVGAPPPATGAQQSAQPAPVVETTRRRGRPPAAAQQPAVEPLRQQPAAAPLFTPGNGAIQQPQPASEDLNALLARAMAPQG
jgi:hypothetical protein